ncbi:secreted RxLR effector protein 161-like [Humulus lupulus]|uniref:secreted RxLR effector protein 161-like n=1 Tax=Humulus lupulus TaxID=3486 RepID=UPI002B409249|nr:secreted RxLR effector protein 161-like [Humulus lupulus]
MKLHQMDVKSSFLNGILQKEVFVEQPTGFKDPHLLDHMENGIFISQSNFTLNMLKKFGLEHSKHARTPIGTTSKLTRDVSGKSVDPTLFCSMIGSLLYLIVSRPDICFSVGLYARYQASPTESHLVAVKRIMKYVAGTVEFGLWYTNGTNMSLVGYNNSVWAGNLDDRKSTVGGCFYLSNNLVSWHSKKIKFYFSFHC